MKIIFLTFLFMSFSAWSGVNLELTLDTPAVKQGQIAAGRLQVKETTGNAGLAGLKGKTFGKTLYIYSMDPFIGKEGQLESEVKVIFTKVPSATAVSEVINGEEIIITWQAVEVSPTEEVKNFLFGDFEVPERKNVLPWLYGLLGASLLFGLGYWLYSKQTKKSKAKAQKLKVMEELTNCKTYDDVVLMWRQKRRYLEVFPSVEGEFRNLEEVLFKYQFKPQRTEQEVEAVVQAYQKFKTNVAGAIHGI